MVMVVMVGVVVVDDIDDSGVAGGDDDSGGTAGGSDGSGGEWVWV